MHTGLNNLHHFFKVPEQVTPSPVYPALHIQSYDPTELLHVAWSSQSFSEEAEHSSMSEKEPVL